MTQPRKTDQFFEFNMRLVDTAHSVDSALREGKVKIDSVLERESIPLSRVVITHTWAALRPDLQWQVDVIRGYPVLAAYQRFDMNEDWKTWDGRIRPDYSPIVAFKDPLLAAAYGYKLLGVVEAHGGK